MGDLFGGGGDDSSTMLLVGGACLMLCCSSSALAGYAYYDNWLCEYNSYLGMKCEKTASTDTITDPLGNDTPASTGGGGAGDDEEGDKDNKDNKGNKGNKDNKDNKDEKPKDTCKEYSVDEVYYAAKFPGGMSKLIPDECKKYGGCIIDGKTYYWDRKKLVKTDKSGGLINDDGNVMKAKTLAVPKSSWLNTYRTKGSDRKAGSKAGQQVTLGGQKYYVNDLCEECGKCDVRIYAGALAENDFSKYAAKFKKGTKLKLAS